MVDSVGYIEVDRKIMILHLEVVCKIMENHLGGGTRSKIIERMVGFGYSSL